MQDAIRVFAGDCSVSYEPRDDRPREQRGAVVVLVKPDNTVLVHDANGYQPAAWLTRADAVRFARDDETVTVDAVKEDARLRVECRAEYGHAHYHASPAGPVVGECPDCGGALVRDGGAVVCTQCLAWHGIPRDATVLDCTCDDCGRPLLRAERGDAFDVCLDYACESLDDAVRERFDGAWSCPSCEGPLAIRRRRGLRAVCDACGHSYALPAGTVVGECACGLPRFETATGTRCLDPACAGDAPPDGSDPTP